MVQRSYGPGIHREMRLFVVLNNDDKVGMLLERAVVRRKEDRMTRW